MSSNTEKLYTEFTAEMKKDYTILAPDIFPTTASYVTVIFRHGVIMTIS